MEGDEWRTAGAGRNWFMVRWSCCMKRDGSTFGRVMPGARHRQGMLRMTADPCKRCVSRGLAEWPRSTAHPYAHGGFKCMV